MAIYVECARIRNPFAIQITWLKNQPFIPPAKYRPLTLAVHQNQRLRTGASGDDCELCLHASTGKRLAV
jgi:hypothetical protein